MLEPSTTRCLCCFISVLSQPNSLLRCTVMSARGDDPTAEVTDLLQHLIRNACVNDGRPTSGGETRSADVLEAYLRGPGLDLARYERAAGRANLVARIEGRDPGAPSLLLMGHTDVVPANADRWQR